MKTNSMLLVLIATFLTTLSFIQCEVNYKPLDPAKFPGTPIFSASKMRGREGKALTANSVCECNLESQEEGVVCANNGIVYKNVCQFNCAKKKNIRLKVVQKGKSCAGLNRKDFWDITTKSSTTSKNSDFFGLDLMSYFNQL